MMEELVGEVAGGKTAPTGIVLLNPAGKISRLADIMAAVSQTAKDINEEHGVVFS